jgi:hypothetical protein
MDNVLCEEHTKQISNLSTKIDLVNNKLDTMSDIILGYRTEAERHNKYMQDLLTKTLDNTLVDIRTDKKFYFSLITKCVTVLSAIALVVYKANDLLTLIKFK